MKVLSLLCLSFLFVWPALAQEVKVLKVKGNKAVIKIPKDMEISKGQTLMIGGGDEGDEEGGGSTMAKGSGSRNTALAMSFSMTSLSFERTTSAGGKSTGDSNTISLAVSYGWNKGWAEYGPVFIYQSSDNGSSKSTEFDLGGYFEYNFKTNKPGEWMIPAAGIQVAWAQLSQETTGSSADGNGPLIDIYFSCKLFPWSDNFAISPTLGYRMVTYDFSEYKDSYSGLVLAASIMGYF
ncbi:MAG: hypothetical protein H6624_12095 [Bdellovibrionaceae bacterium]|nr:hypothetical protein [Bdellovibrionales bacterium]MCB9085083.1 hypothetical protein [Pseudobdellovibrionaceae bacterium]